jgi:hypothetical protein
VRRSAHQFTFEHPHLVCCHPPHFDGPAAALASKRFMVLAAGPGALRGPLMPRTMLLRRQPLIEQETLVRGSLATPEKAWIDLLRETRRSQLLIDYGELRRLLRAMTEYGVNQRAGLLRTAHRLPAMAPSRNRPASAGSCGAASARGGLRGVSVADHPEHVRRGTASAYFVERKSLYR